MNFYFGLFKTLNTFTKKQMESLGEQIKRFRKKAKLTQTELSQLVTDMNLRKADISLYENDKQIPRHDNLTRLCEAMGVEWVIVLRVKKR